MELDVTVDVDPKDLMAHATVHDVYAAYNVYKRRRDETYKLMLLLLDHLAFDGPAYEVECVRKASELVNKARKGV